MQLPVLGPVLHGLCVIKQTLLSGLVRAWDPAVQEGLRISHGESPPADSLQFWASSGLDVLPLRILSTYSWECSERQGPCAPLLFPLGTLRTGHFSSAHCGFMQWPCSVSTCLKTNPSTGPLFVFEIYSEPDYFLHPPPPPPSWSKPPPTRAWIPAKTLTWLSRSCLCHQQHSLSKCQ